MRRSASRRGSGGGDPRDVESCVDPVEEEDCLDLEEDAPVLFESVLRCDLLFLRFGVSSLSVPGMVGERGDWGCGCWEI